MYNVLKWTHDIESLSLFLFCFSFCFFLDFNAMPRLAINISFKIGGVGKSAFSPFLVDFPFQREGECAEVRFPLSFFCRRQCCLHFRKPFLVHIFTMMVKM